MKQIRIEKVREARRKIVRGLYGEREWRVVVERLLRALRKAR